MSDKKMLTFTTSKGQIHKAVARNNYLNNWAFNEKIDCIKAVFWGESIRGNHFSGPWHTAFINICCLKCMILPLLSFFVLFCHSTAWWTRQPRKKLSYKPLRVSRSYNGWEWFFFISFYFINVCVFSALSFHLGKCAQMQKPRNSLLGRPGMC